MEVPPSLSSLASVQTSSVARRRTTEMSNEATNEKATAATAPPSCAPSMCSVTVVELTGDETEEQCQEIAYQMFCNAHPVEAYEHDPERFWTYFHSRAPDISREQMVALLKASEEPESPNDPAETPAKKS